MSEDGKRGTGGEDEVLRAEIARLNKVVDALMDRAEDSSLMQDSEYNAFRATILLEDQVRRRTEELQAALRDKEEILQELWISEARFRGIVNQPVAGICIIEEGKITFANAKFAEIFGYAGEEVLGLTLQDMAAPVDQRLVAEQLRRRASGEIDQVDYIFRGQRKNGAQIDIECHGSVMILGQQRLLLSLINDVTERIRAERAIRELQEQLRELAIHDPLTGLYNRLPLNEFFDREISLAARHNRSLSVVLCDIDHFKKINDQYGHLAGDEMLKHVAELIRSVFRSSDIFCRFGGEEFLILLPDTTAAVALERTEWLRETLSDCSVQYGGVPICLTASFGMAIYPDDGLNRGDLIAAADRALYVAKNNGRNQVRTAS